MPCLYIHRRPNNEIFYVGIGKDKYRPYAKDGRNKYWHNIVNKYGYTIEIIFELDDYELIKQKERELIAFYGKLHTGKGTLCNLTDGGEGCLGLKWSKESRENAGINLRKRYLNNLIITGSKTTKEHREAISKGNKNPTMETRIKMSINNAKTKSSKVIDISTSKIYLTIKEAAKELGYNYNTLKAQVRGQNPNRTNIKYLNYAL